MLAEQHLREGKLDEALSALQDAVRKEPAEARYRVFLFQLLSVLGQWERALNQLNVAGEMDPATLAMCQTYREGIACEVFRHAVFRGERSPLLFGEPEEWTASLLQALKLHAGGHVSEAAALRERAFESAPATSGTIDGTSFEWITDGDSRLGPILEAVLNGRYYWIPFHLIRTIDVEEPADLRDYVWTPCHFVWANGGEAVGLVPTRYAGSEESDDPLVRLGRKTVWEEPGHDTFVGHGQRMWMTDAGEYPLMDARKVELRTGNEADGGDPPP